MTQQNFCRYFSLFALLFAAATLHRPADGQVVINEFLYDDGADPDEGEFLELYNAGEAAVDIGGWAIVTSDDAGEFASDPIPAGSMIGPGDYFVIADATNVPNVDFDIGFTDIWPDANNIVELKDTGGNVIDAIAYEINKNNGVEWRTAAQISLTGAAGIWGNVQASAGPQALARYLDGRNTNVNGRDFGLIRKTPGESNNLPQVGMYVLPDYSGLAIGDAAPDFTASFVGPIVVDPTVVGPNLGASSDENPNAVPASPNGGNVLSAWDAAGGGNQVVSDALVTGYDLNVYLKTDPLGTTGTESTTYGIGTTLTFYNTPDPSGLIDPSEPYPANGNTGIGWLYEKEDSSGLNSLKLIDFGPGGNSSPIAAPDWTIIEDLDMSGVESGWYRLSLDFDPATGEVDAIFDDQSFSFTTSTDLLGTFYVGYREGVDQLTFADRIRPPLFEQFLAPAGDDADFDDDNDVDGSDFLAWQRGYPITDGTGQAADGDANGDGNVNDVDLAIFESQFGTAVAAASGQIPEPSALAIAAGALCLTFARGRRRAKFAA